MARRRSGGPLEQDGVGVGMADSLIAGADYYDRRHAERVRHRAIQTLERQGYRVTLEPAA
jgi:hypothetical protein